MKKIIVLILLCTVMLGCTDDKKYAPKEGRISVFEANEPTKSTGTVKIEKAAQNTLWSAPLYNTQNRLPNTTIAWDTKPLWKEKGGTQKANELRLLPIPVASSDSLYVLDAGYTLTKLNIENGKTVWQQKLGDNKIGISLAANKNTLFALSMDGTITAFSSDGKQLWQKNLNVPVRSDITVDGYALYLVTTHNQFIVLSQKTGAELWHYKTTKPQTLLTYMAPPAKGSGILVVPFATGEVIAFDADSGLLQWAQMMIGDRPQDLTEIPQIAAAPVIDGQTVYLIGNANSMGAYDLQTGTTKWINNYASKHTPIISGNTLFILSTQNHLVALDKKTGKIFWEKPFVPKDKTAWMGIRMFGDLLALYDTEKMILIEPKTGEITATKSYDLATHPITVQGHLITENEKTKITFYQ